MSNQIKNKKTATVVKMSLIFVALTFVCTVYARTTLEDKLAQGQLQTTAVIDVTETGWVATDETCVDALSWIYEESGVSGKRLGKAGDLTYVVYTQCDSKGETVRQVIVAQTDNVGAEFDISNFPSHMEATDKNMELALLETK